MGKVTLSIPDALLEKIDVGADELMLSRSAYITMRLVQAFNADETMSRISELSRVMDESNKIIKDGKEIQQSI